MLHCDTLWTAKLNFMSAMDCMVKLVCKDYGFECNFVADDDDHTNVIVKFGKHTEEEHGIEYSKEAIMQFILRRS